MREIVLGGLLVLALLFEVIDARAQDCPADRPHRVEIDIDMMNCTLLACLGPLLCEEKETTTAGTITLCGRGPVSDCNTCTRAVTVACLSDDDLKAARK
jgi:hypothetical protein